MNSPSYNVKTNDPCSFRKEVLLETLIILKANLAPEASLIELALKKGGIKKNEKHNSQEAFDYYWVKCTAEEAETIASYLFDAEASAIPSSGETTPEAIRYAELVDIWKNFGDWLNGGGSVTPHWESE